MQLGEYSMEEKLLRWCKKTCWSVLGVGGLDEGHSMQQELLREYLLGTACFLLYTTHTVLVHSSDAIALQCH